MKQVLDEKTMVRETEYSHKNLRRVIDEFPEDILHQEKKLRKQLAKGKIGNEKKLLRVYEFYDLAEHALSPFTPCKKGCSSCCHYNVSVTEDEAQLIERKSGKKRRKQIGPSRDYHGEPCPFLSASGECTIYNARPYSCRRHYALTETAYLCDPIKCNDTEVALVRFSDAESAFDQIRQGQNVLDIRQLFE